MKFFFWFCLLLLIPGLLLRIPVGGAGILATDILLPIFSAVWIFKKLVVDRDFPRSTFLLSGFSFFGIACLTWLLATPELEGKEMILSAAHLLRLISFLIFGWSAVDIFDLRSLESGFTKKSPDTSFFIPFFWIGGSLIALGLLQFRFIPDISTWSTEGGLDPHTGRLLGTWLDPNFIAGFLGFFMPLVIGKWYHTENKKEKFWLLLLFLFSLLALFLTFSRSGYLASGIGLLIFFLFRDPKIILLGIIIAIIGIASNERAQKRTTELWGTMSSIVLRETDEIDPTASLRLANWRKSFQLWEKYPFFGIGYNTYRYRASEEGIVDENYFSAGGSDSTHLTVLVTTGIVGILAYLWFLLTLWIAPLKQFFKTRNELFLGFCAGLGALVIHACFVNSLFFPFIFLPLIATAGVLETMNNDQ